MAITANTGSNNWNTNGAWVGGVQPTAADDVILPNTAVVTIPTATTVLGRSITAQAGSTLAFASTTAVLTLGDGTAGAGNVAVSVSGTATITLTGVGVINLISTSATQQTIDSGGKTLPSLTVNGVGSSYQVAANLTLSTTATLTLTSGTLDTNGKTLSTGFFAGSGALARTLTLGATTWTLTGGSGTHWTFSTDTNLTFNANTSTIVFSYTSTCQCTLGNQNYNNMTFNVLMGIGLTVTMGTGGAHTFNNLNFTGTTGSTTNSRLPAFSCTADTTLTVNGTFTFNGKDIITRLMQDCTVGRVVTINAAVVSISNCDFKNITAGGAGTWSGTSIGDGGGNSGITFTTPVTRYWVGGTGNWSQTTHWSASSGGAGSAGVPLIHDTVYIDANSGAGTISTNHCPAGKDISFRGASGSSDYTGIITSSSSNVTFTGSLTLSPSMTVNAASGITFTNWEGRGSHRINLYGLNLNPTSATGYTIKATGGSYTFDSSMTGLDTQQFDIQSGTVDFNGYDLTIGGLSSSNSITRTITFGSGTISLGRSNATIWSMATITNLTLNPGANPILFTYSGASNTRTISTGSLTEAMAPHFSFTAGSDTIAGTFRCKDLNFTGFSGAWTKPAHTIYGSITISNTMTIADSANATTMAHTSGTKTITCNTNTFGGPITVNAPGGTVSLVDKLTIPATRTLTLTAGTFTDNGQDMSIGKIDSSGATTRVLNMSGTTTITGTASTIFQFSTTTNLTGTQSGTINFTASIGAGTRTITGAGGTLVFNNVNFTDSTDTISLNNLRSANLSFVGFTGALGYLTNASRVTGNLTYGAGMTETDSSVGIVLNGSSGTGTITTNRVKLAHGMTIDAVGATYNLADEYRLIEGSTRGFAVSGGTFNTQGYDMWVATFSCTNTSQTCVVNTGKSRIYCYNDSTTNTFDFRNTANNTFDLDETRFVQRGFISASVRALNVSLGSAFVWGDNYVENGTSGTNYRLQQQTVEMGTLFYRGKTNTLSINGAGSGWTFRGDFDVRGDPTGGAGNVTLSCNGNAPADLIKTTGYVVCDYLTISDMATAGGAMWFAGKNSVNAGGTNAGWIWTASRRRIDDSGTNATTRTAASTRTASAVRTSIY